MDYEWIGKTNYKKSDTKSKLLKSKSNTVREQKTTSDKANFCSNHFSLECKMRAKNPRQKLTRFFVAFSVSLWSKSSLQFDFTILEHV